jgi:hypothetical protein
MQIFIAKYHGRQYNTIMNIILGDKAYNQVKDKYIVLELDTFRIDEQEHKSYCVLDAGDIPLGEMPELPLWQENHAKFIENWHKGDFNFCEQMVDHLMKRWGGHMNSFYTTVFGRIQELKEQDLPEDWDGVIQK